ncbi:MAG: biotin-dependent carboxyltransferase family protein [Gemmatimonadales bacterium]
MIEIVKAPPYATVQDFGFPRGRAWGLPPAGAMDPYALAVANAFVENPGGAAAIEWALGPLVLKCERETLLAAIPMAEIRVGDERVKQPGLVTAPAQVPITLVPKPRYRFGYLAVRGGFDVPTVLGSRSTYLTAGLGGFQGRRLQSGDHLPIGTLPRVEAMTGTLRSTASELLVDRVAELPELVLRTTLGPQWERFDSDAQFRFFESIYTVDRASDRSGYRLSGPPLAPRERATLPSEAACPGAVQIPDNGQPIVLMPDGPTIGGYPKIGVVNRRDLARLAQCQPGQLVRFWGISMEDAWSGARDDEILRLAQAAPQAGSQSLEASGG